MTDLIIIGAGTAGLTAAIYGARAGLTVKIIEKSFFGGQIISTTSIENYPGMPGIHGADFATALYKQAKDLGVAILYETILSTQLVGNIKQLVTSKEIHLAKTVVIATGAKPKKLGVPGEDKLIGRGVGFCVTCDGALYKGKVTAVIGGGNVAIENSLILSDLCRTVIIIHRSIDFKAEKIQLDILNTKTNIQLITSTIVQEFIGDSTLEKILVENTSSGHISEISIDGAFIAIGAEPDSALFAHELSLDETGYVIADEDCLTNLPGVFVAGDVRTKRIRQIVTATADGSVAALAAKEYLMRN